MEISYLENIIKLVSDSAIEELEIEEGGNRIRISKPKINTVTSVQIPQQFYPTQQFAPAVSPQPEPTVIPATPLKSNAKEIRSPIVGTFYRTPAPDAPPYVEVGSTIKVGTVLCIVEAMKLMNEIESDIEGKIVKILVENGKPVEFNQLLFLVEPLN
jgi:acetyl-CoA carboxylase biotin carboxyl carrier protein